MVQTFCTSGRHEGIKGSVHGAAAVIAAVMAGYNIAAYFYRRDAHLRMNAIVYSLAVAWEIKQTLHHLDKTPRRELRETASINSRQVA